MTQLCSLRRVWASLLIAMILLAATVPGMFAEPVVPAPRLVVIMLDMTRSFQTHRPDAKQAIGRIEAALGPRDRLMMVYIGAPPFVPSKQVRETLLPDVSPTAIYASTANEFGNATKELTAAWDETERIKMKLAQEISQPPSIDVSYTDIHTPLEYVQERMTAPQFEKFSKTLVLFSDLETDVKGGLKTGGPPKTQMSFRNAKVYALFVPWKAGGAIGSKIGAWKTFFETGGATFALHDEVASRSIAVLAKSPVPKRPANPFQKQVAAGR